jgi:hypothetical protein
VEREEDQRGRMLAQALDQHGLDGPRQVGAIAHRVPRVRPRQLEDRALMQQMGEIGLDDVDHALGSAEKLMR